MEGMMTELLFQTEAPDDAGDRQTQDLSTPLDPVSTEADPGGSKPSIDDKSGKSLESP